MKAVYALLLVVTLVHGHAVLLTPTPFNTNPSTTAPCGVATVSTAMMSTNQAAWTAGDEVSITWHLVASDGGGPVKGAFDPNGGTAFTVDAGFSQATSGSNIYYNIKFTVPSNLTCANSPTKLCTFRVYSPGWSSCTAVSVTPKAGGGSGGAPPPVPTTCVAVTKGSLSFCPNVTTALVKGSAAPRDINTELQTAYTTNLGNPNVFQPPAATKAACNILYQQLLCSMSLPSCDITTGDVIPGTQACRGFCRKTMEACGIQAAHVDLYDCSDLDEFPLCPGESDDSVTGPSSKGMSAGGKAALSLFFIALVGAAVFAGFTYHKQGHLFGYTFDMESKRVVKHQANPHNYKAYVDHEASL